MTAVMLTLALVLGAEPQPKPETPKDPAPVASDAGAPKPVDEEVAKPRPWAKGVSKERQADALALYKRGNELYANTQCEKAVIVYRNALKAWDHPSIQFNLAMCLVELQNDLPAYEAFLAALRFGQGPLSVKSFREARKFQRILKRGLAFAKIVCNEPGALVTVDGAKALVGPGTVVKPMLPGKHDIIGSKVGFVTRSLRPNLPAGVETVVDVSLDKVVTTKLERYWDEWVPWVVLGSGLVVGAIGVPLYVEAKSDFETYDQQLLSKCPGSTCPQITPDAETAALETRGQDLQNSAIAMWAIGGATVVAGVVMLVLNVERQVPVEQPVVGFSPRPGGGSLTLRTGW